MDQEDADDDDDDDDSPDVDDDDDDGDGDVDDDDDDDDTADAELSFASACFDPVFQASVKFLMQECGKMMAAMNKGQEVKVRPTAHTRNAIAAFVFEHIWLPAKGDYEDEFNKDKWLEL